MKRRIFALLLVVAMLCPMILTGCGGKNSSDTGDSATKETAPREAVSITMWVVTDKNTTEAAKAAVEEEFNKITKSTFTTYVDLVFVTPEEYETKLNQKFAQIENMGGSNDDVVDDEFVVDGGDAAVTKPTTEAELETNEFGVTVLKYPEILENQVDIVFIDGFDMLYNLATAGKLQNLNSYINDTGASKILNGVIPSQLFTYSKINKVTYGIPNNRVIGEYTYLLVKKDVVTGDANGDGVISGDEMNGSYYNFNEIADIFDCEKVIEYIKNNRTDLIPVLSSFDNPYIHNWTNKKDDSFSILGSSLRKEGGNLGFDNIFEVDDFTKFELLMKKLEVGSYFATDVETAKKNQNFGVAVLKGDSTVIDEYGDNYYIKVVKNPTLTDDNVFGTFYGVTTYSKNVARAMEIITMLNTNSELRNVLQYGVEGVHYELDENDRVDRFNNDYIMDINNTGNVFIAYPEEDMDDEVWDRGIKTNLDVKLSKTIGIWATWANVNASYLNDLDVISQTYKQRMDACETVEQLAAFFETAKAEVAALNEFVAATNAETADTPLAVYTAWLASKNNK